MEIYAEYLFVENFIMGAIILSLSAKVGALPTNKKRIGIGSVLCGFFSFIIFPQNIGTFTGICMKILFSILLSYVTFGKNLWKGTLLIYIISIFCGGMTIMLLYISKIKGIANNAVLYINDVSYTNIAFGAAVSFGCIILFVEIFKGKQLRERIFTDIVLEIEGHSILHRALIDSGNFLREPLTGKAVAIISKSAASGLRSFTDIDFAKRYCLVPYNSIGVKKGILEGYRVDNVYVNNQPMGSMVVAVYDSEFCMNGGEEYQILLSKDFLTGGVA